MTHSAAMASEILPGKVILEALNFTDLVCVAISARYVPDSSCRLFYGRAQSAFSEGGLAIRCWS